MKAEQAKHVSEFVKIEGIFQLRSISWDNGSGVMMVGLFLEHAGLREPVQDENFLLKKQVWNLFKPPCQKKKKKRFEWAMENQ